MKFKYVGMTVLAIGALTLTGCSQSASNPKSANVKSSDVVIHSKVAKNVVGTYKDDQDGAAIKFNEDHTGRYVYRDQ